MLDLEFGDVIVTATPWGASILLCTRFGRIYVVTYSSNGSDIKINRIN